MPELPEVETIVRSLREPLVGRRIVGVVFPSSVGRMTNLDAQQWAARIAGQPIREIGRRAKYLVFRLDPDTLVVHLKLTGHLYIASPGEESRFDRWLRVYFLLDDGHELRFSDSRRFGRIYLCREPAEVLPELGPEPLDDSFTLDAFRQRLAGRSGALKSLLLNQAFVAGVGNIYADEALHIARLHPLRRADDLSEEDSERLYHAIRQALHDGLRFNGASIGWYRQPDGEPGAAQEHLRAYRMRGDVRPCPVCGTPISVIRIGQRSAHFCPTCQPR